jgi:hypothetical protein
MDTQSRFSHLERNPKTHAEHRREVFWQITLPLVFGILLVLAAVIAIILSATRPVTDLGRWADVSLMWLILPSLFFALLLLILLVGFIFLCSFLLRLVPHYAHILQIYFELAKTKISRLANGSIEPILRISSIWAAMRYAIGRGTRREHEQDLK